SRCSTTTCRRRSPPARSIMAAGCWARASSTTSSTAIRCTTSRSCATARGGSSRATRTGTGTESVAPRQPLAEVADAGERLVDLHLRRRTVARADVIDAGRAHRRAGRDPGRPVVEPEGVAVLDRDQLQLLRRAVEDPDVVVEDAAAAAL